MQIHQAKFVTSRAELNAFPGQGLPEIAACGKSNVGKSSLINRLGHNKKLARTSAEPGKTRLINIYDFDGLFHFVDLPGYGFAKAPKDEKEKWARMIEGYLSGSEHLKRVLQLVDIRHPPTSDDIMMVNYLRHYQIPFLVLATKADKLSKAQQSRQIPVICRALAVQPWEVIPFSAEDGQGLEKLLGEIEGWLAPTEAEPE